MLIGWAGATSFCRTAEAMTWRVDYNQRRRHSSLGHLTPNEFVRQRQEDRALEGAPLQLQPVS